ncbi:MAG: hypothetical protein GXO93_04750 [FCB group bacterium]|nr:hypothetical protein [FCB group bacterium]
MKRFLTVLAFVLILTLCLWGQVFALGHPYHETYVPIGDDHPWGGEQVASSITPTRTEIDSPGFLSTGIPVVDVVINNFTLFKKLRFYIYHHSTIRQIEQTSYERNIERLPSYNSQQNYNKKGDR